jgi:hypothetical protein
MKAGVAALLLMLLGAAAWLWAWRPATSPPLVSLEKHREEPAVRPPGARPDAPVTAQRSRLEDPNSDTAMIEWEPEADPNAEPNPDWLLQELLSQTSSFLTATPDLQRLLALLDSLVRLAEIHPASVKNNSRSCRGELRFSQSTLIGEFAVSDGHYEMRLEVPVPNPADGVLGVDLSLHFNETPKGLERARATLRFPLAHSRRKAVTARPIHGWTLLLEAEQITAYPLTYHPLGKLPIQQGGAHGDAAAVREPGLAVENSLQAWQRLLSAVVRSALERQDQGLEAGREE